MGDRKKNNIGLFPSTPPVGFTKNHFRFLEILLKGDMLQKDLVKALGIDKTTLSNIKQDFIHLGWATDLDFGNGKEVKVRLCRLNELNTFLAGWYSVRRLAFVRPHSILYRVISKGQLNELVLDKLTEKYHVTISHINGNKQYSIKTDYGTIVLFLNSNIVDFWVEGFILPINQEDIENLEYYICSQMEDRVLKMHDIIREHFSRSGFEISKAIYLKSLHLGIVTKENISNILGLRERIKELDMFFDDSIYGCKEIEAKGNLEIINKVKIILNRMLNEV